MEQRMDREPARRWALRDPVSGLTHLFAAVAALAGLIVLLVLGAGDPVKEISLLIYGLCLIALFSASATYHMVNGSTSLIAWLRKVDHSVIYIFIAGTYTPICLYFFDGFWKWGLLAIIWLMALTGVIVKLFVINAPRWVTAGVYLVMGWLGIIGIRQIVASMPAAAIAWLVLGGILFTVGAVIYITKKPDPWPGVFGFHEIWHIFIILACLSHYILIATYIAAA
jgi:hemolysin III